MLPLFYHVNYLYLFIFFFYLLFNIVDFRPGIILLLKFIAKAKEPIRASLLSTLYIDRIKHK